MDQRVFTIEENVPLKYWLPYLNEHDNANRTGIKVGAALKKKATEFVQAEIEKMDMKPIDYPFTVGLCWGVNTKHDYDNVFFAKKYVLDGMQKAGFIPNDNPKYFRGMHSESVVHIGRQFVSVHIKEVVLP